MPRPHPDGLLSDPHGTGDGYAIGSSHCSPILSEVSGAASLLNAAGINDTEDCGYGWCPQGERFAAERRGSRTQRVSFIAG
ncbi:MAG: hypothetical protein AAF827_08830 [Cyanobacteria bacterium P01_D01_bin.6]